MGFKSFAPQACAIPLCYNHSPWRRARTKRFLLPLESITDAIKMNKQNNWRRWEVRSKLWSNPNSHLDNPERVRQQLGVVSTATAAQGWLVKVPQVPGTNRTRHCNKILSRWRKLAECQTTKRKNIERRLLNEDVKLTFLKRKYFW